MSRLKQVESDLVHTEDETTQHDAPPRKRRERMCRRCWEPFGHKGDGRCQNCGVHKNTRVSSVPRWLRRLAGS